MGSTIAQAEVAGTHFLKLGGELRHDNAAGLEALIEHWFAVDSPPVQSVVIDLCALEFMDSTVIGLLACIVRELDGRDLPQATVFSTQPEINQLLHSLCLDEALTLIKAAPTRDTPLDLESPALAELSGQVSAASILRAHEQLIELNEANRSAFQPVVDLLRQG